MQSNLTGNPPQPPQLNYYTNLGTEGLYTYLTWSNIGGDNFTIYRNRDDGQFSLLAFTNNKFYNDTKDDTSFTGGLWGTIKYGYYVTALNKYGVSAPSNTIYFGPLFKQQNTTCTDSDGGKNYFTKGTTYGRHQVGQGPQIKNWDDYCANPNSLVEFSCRSLTYPDSDKLDVWSDYNNCPNGCNNGACIQNSSQPIFKFVSPEDKNLDGGTLVVGIDKWIFKLGNAKPGYKVAVKAYKASGIPSNADIGYWKEYISIYDEKGNVINNPNEDYIKFYVSASQTQTLQQSQQSAQSSDQAAAGSLNSCASRCGNYNSNADCQCDNACINYNDCCADKNSLCG